MRTNIIWAMAVILVALLEAQWPYVLRVQGVVPQLVLILVLLASRQGEANQCQNDSLGGKPIHGVIRSWVSSWVVQRIIAHEAADAATGNRVRITSA